MSSVLFSVCSLIIPDILCLLTFLYSFLQHLPVNTEALHLTDGERGYRAGSAFDLVQLIHIQTVKIQIIASYVE